MPESPKSVFGFPDWIPPFRDNQIVTLSLALRVRRDNPTVRNTWRVREAVSQLYHLPVYSEEVWDICTQFFADRRVGSYHVGNLMERISRAENDPDRTYVNLTPED